MHTRYPDATGWRPVPWPEAHIEKGYDDLALHAANTDVRAFATLPEDHHGALPLQTQGGMSLLEIAYLKYAALGTVSAWVHRARTKIARVLDEADR